MLRFGTNTNKRHSARKYSSRREQMRLLALFVPLALVILLMARLRDPITANAIYQFFTGTGHPHQPDIKPQPVVAESAPVRSPALLPGILPDLLKTIEDNTYFRAAEKGAWFHFFEQLRKEDVITAPGIPVEYAQLVDQPKVYRGTLVTVRGTARQITQEKPADNEIGIESYYRVVIQPADGANWPIIVYCIDLPNGVSPRDELALDVTATGLFFKKLSYKWRDGLGIAPVVVAKGLDLGAVIVASESSSEHEGSDSWATADEECRQANVDMPVEYEIGPLTESQQAIQKMLALDGWGIERLTSFDEGAALSDTQRAEALELLRRLRTINFDSLVDWYNSTPRNYELKNADEVRGVFHRLIGNVKKVTWRKLATEESQRLEMQGYFECEFAADNLSGPITVLTARVPNAWPRNEALNEPAWAKAFIVKRRTDEIPPRTVWLATEIAWHPGIREFEQARSLESMFRKSPDPLLGRSMLGALYVDVGQFDLVESRGRIRPQERDIFYHMLSAAGHINATALVRLAADNLPVVQQYWRGQVAVKGDARRAALASEVVRRADEGCYSIAMLFNDPEPQIGRLFMFDGVARRAVRVEVPSTCLSQNRRRLAHFAESSEQNVPVSLSAYGSGISSKSIDGGATVFYPYGFDQYYELEVFTDDSQNYPLIFCVRELPNEFPIGADIRVPVRVAGFFFKNWLYSTRGRSHSEQTADAKSSGPRAQFAPLLIGSAPIVLESAQPVGHAGRFVLSGLFVLAMLGIWAAAAWFARDDRRFRQRTPAANFALPPGQSLNDLNLPTADVPMTTEVWPPSGESSN